MPFGHGQLGVQRGARVFSGPGIALERELYQNIIPNPAEHDRRKAYAGVAQLAEHNVANVVVVGSNPITRSFFWIGSQFLLLL